MNSELANLKALWSWASSNGANLTSIEPTVIMRDGEVQRTVRASSKIPNLQEIASIPLCILMSETKALASPVGKCLAAYFQTIPDQVEFQPARAKGLISLIVFMVYERFQMEKDSFFHPYLSTLPKDFPTLPFFYSDSELDAYIGKETNLVKTVRSKLLILRQGFDIANIACSHLFTRPESLTWDHFMWSYANISSRAFPLLAPVSPGAPLVATRDPEIAMWPVLDLCNHRPKQPIEWSVKESLDVSYVCRERDGLKKGDEIFSNYGGKGNEMLLSAYGFVVDDNPNDYFKLQLAIDLERDPLGKEKKRIIEERDANTSHLLFADDDGNLIDSPLMGSMRLYVLNRIEISTLREKSGYFGTRNELSALSHLHLLLARSLSLIGTSEGVEIVSCTPLDLEKRKMGGLYRDSQVKILLYFLEKIEQEFCQLLKLSSDPVCLLPLDFLLMKSIDFSSIFPRFQDITKMCDETDEDTIASILIASSRVKIVRGNDSSEEYEDHFKESVVPLLQEFGLQDIVDCGKFLDACAYLEQNEFHISRELFAKVYPAVVSTEEGGALSFPVIVISDKF